MDVTGACKHAFIMLFLICISIRRRVKFVCLDDIFVRLLSLWIFCVAESVGGWILNNNRIYLHCFQAFTCLRLAIMASWRNSASIWRSAFSLPEILYHILCAARVWQNNPCQLPLNMPCVKAHGFSRQICLVFHQNCIKNVPFKIKKCLSWKTTKKKKMKRAD